MEAEFEDALDRPRVSVVVVNHDGVDFLWHCLFALKTQTYPVFEIILVDNASEDASVSFVKANYPLVKVMECQENFGFAMGANLGAKVATGEIVALLNNDAVVTPDWLYRMVSDFREQWPKAGALASAVKTNKGVEGRRSEDHLTLNILGERVEGYFEDPRTIFYPEGCALMYARFLAPEGPFDPDYFIYQEDVYLGWKFRLANRQVKRSLDARIFHEPGGTMSRFQGWKTVYYQTRNRWLNLFLFYGTANLLKVLPWMVLDALVRQVRSLGVGVGSFLGNLFAVGWILSHPAAIYRKRKAIQEKRKVKDREILKFISGRVARDGGFLSRWLNFLSLTYCLVVGLGVLEFPEEK
jgi:GT2 family glycosyltransferase